MPTQAQINALDPYARLNAVVGAWLRASNPDMPAGRIVSEPTKGTRPTASYLSVNVTLGFRFLDTQARVEGDGTFRKLAESTVTVQSFGAPAWTWLQRAALHLDDPSVIADLERYGFDLRAPTGVQDLTTFLETDNELRGALDVLAVCALVSEQVRLFAEAETLAVDGTLGTTEIDVEVSTPEAPA